MLARGKTSGSQCTDGQADENSPVGIAQTVTNTHCPRCDKVLFCVFALGTLDN